MIRCTVETLWVLLDGMYAADVVWRFPGEWSDVSGQTDAQIPTNPEGAIFSGRVSADVFALISSDPAVTVINSETEG